MYMPKLLFVCLLVLSVLKLIYSLKDDPTPIEVKIAKKKMLIGMGTIILIGLYCVLFKTLGFVIVTFLYLVGQMALFCPGRKRWGLVVLIALFDLCGGVQPDAAAWSAQKHSDLVRKGEKTQ